MLYFFQVYGHKVDSPNDKSKLIEENATLIVETNALRKDLKTEQKKNHTMEAILGLSKKTILPKEGMRLMKQAISTREEIHKEYQEQLKVSSV